MDNDSSFDNSEFPPLPSELRYLLEPSIEYGRKYKFADEVRWFLETQASPTLNCSRRWRNEARLSGDYHRLMKWMDEIDAVRDHILEEQYPETIASNDKSLADQRKQLELRQIVETNEMLHNMDIYFSFGLMDYCDLHFE